MDVHQQWLAPCGLYCGVCGILIAHRENNQKFKERLATVYNLPVEQIRCSGCKSDDQFIYCQTCPIRECTDSREFEGCHVCKDFPCDFIDHFPMPVGKKVIMRAIPQWREMDTEAWVEAEEKRYHCPACQEPIFRGAKRCRSCQEPVDQD